MVIGGLFGLLAALILLAVLYIFIGFWFSTW